MEGYLKEFHNENITNLLNDGNDFVHVSLNVNLTHLQRTHGVLFNEILSNVWDASKKWNNALLEAQKQLIEGNIFLEADYQIKENCHVRFVNLPQSDVRLRGSFPNNDHIGLFVQVKGNVIRMTQGKLLEFKREYVCNRCKETFILEAGYSNMFIFEIPKGCLNATGTCKGYLHQKNAHPRAEYCMDYQEIRIQELFSDKNVPASLIVTLENDLVDYCQPGECITICGTIERRWRPFTQGKRSEVIIAMRAISICKDEEKVNFGKDLSEQLICVRAQWQDTIDMLGQLNARDTIIQSICPEIHGMHLVKLAIALALCSGVEYTQTNGSSTRGHSHLLLVGDPGLAKSKLLKAASKIALRSVHTTGMGCSAAGLTAAAIKEEGEWQLEAGALVLADGGVCCIDEFNLMRENDKASIHEAMEQQTISMAKAGLVCKLSTRCVVLAATNPKNLYNMSECEGTSSINIGIGSPLLSRFDIVLILRDERIPEWDARISDHILKNTNSKNITEGLWEFERLQSHFLAVHEINPQISQEASNILGAYYKYCRSDLNRDPSRTTVRLLDSLHRLAQSHARLMFREKVESIDAIVIIRLMESSWGFGRLLNSVDILREDIPLGPNENQIDEVLTLLGLKDLKKKSIEQVKSFNESFNKTKKHSHEDDEILRVSQLENRFGFNKDVNKIPKALVNAKNIVPEVEKENMMKPNLKKLLREPSHLDEPMDLNSDDDDLIKTLEIIENSQNHSENENKNILTQKEPLENPTNTNVNHFDSILLENSSDFDEFDNLDFGKDVKKYNNIDKNSVSTKKCNDLDTNIVNAEKIFKCKNQNASNTENKEKVTSINSQHTIKVQKEILIQDLFSRLDDIDEADLNFDINMPANIKPLNIKNSKDIINKNPENISASPTKKRRKLNENNNVVRNKEIIVNSSSKKNCISSNIIDKLSVFKNPNYSEKSIKTLENVPVADKSVKNDSQDSAYETAVLPSFDKFSSQSSSHILASQDDDLECLNFDI